MAGHAQLKFVMTECSKTQIRLTGLSVMPAMDGSLLGYHQSLVDGGGYRCDPCSENCNNGNCNQTDGFCTEGCVDNWSGSQSNGPQFVLLVTRIMLLCVIRAKMEPLMVLVKQVQSPF